MVVILVTLIHALVYEVSGRCYEPCEVQEAQSIKRKSIREVKASKKQVAYNTNAG
jgi:hypothetical protein